MPLLFLAARSVKEKTVYTKQISVFLENRKGRLAEVTKLLADEQINIRAMTLADMADFGVLRVIVNDRGRCVRALKAHDFVVQETDVIAAEVEDRPGGLHRIIEVLEREGMNIEYMYTFFEKNSDHVIVVLKINDAARTVEMLKKNGIAILPEDAIQNL
jgi:hypothetical protein